MNIPKAESEIRKLGNRNIRPVLERLCLAAMDAVLAELGIEIREDDDIHPPKGQGPGDICPDCGEPLNNQEGCQKCLNCGWSKCA